MATKKTTSNTQSSDQVSGINATIDRINAATAKLGAEKGTSLLKLPKLNVASDTTNNNAGFATSDPVRNEENRIRSDIENLRELASGGEPTDLSKAIADAQKIGDKNAKLLKDRSDYIKLSSDAAEKRIIADYDESKRQLQDSQGRESAAFNVGLSRIGGYLGGSASAMGAVQNLERTHNIEISTLAAKRDAAIQAARDASAKNDFELAQAMVQNARQTQEDISKRKTEFFNQTLALTKEQRDIDSAERQNTQFVQQQANDAMDRIVMAGAEPSADEVMQLAQSLGASPDNILKIVSAKRASYDLEQLEKRSSYDIRILNALSDIPKGTFVTIGGRTYEGKKASSGSGSSVTEIKSDFIQGVSEGMSKEEAYSLYPELDLGYINNYYKNKDESEFNKKIESGEYAREFDENGKEFYYDESKYEQAVKDWATVGKLSDNDTIITVGKKSYKGPDDDTQPYPDDYRVTK